MMITTITIGSMDSMLESTLLPNINRIQQETFYQGNPDINPSSEMSYCACRSRMSKPLSM